MGVGVGVGARGGEGVRVASSSHSSGESSVSECAGDDDGSDNS